MEAIRTICCKLSPSSEQAVAIEATLAAFAGACNYIADAARLAKSTNKYDLQKIVYREVREQFGLSANLTIRAIARVCITLKVPEKRHSAFDPTSIDYDKVIFSFRERDWTFSLTMVSRRERFVARLGDFQRVALRGQRPTSATLVKRHDGQYFLNIQIKELVPDPIPTHNVLGVDLGVVHLAVDSSGEAFSGAKVEEVRQRYGNRRHRLNKCGSKSARRRLRKIRKKESRFRSNENHVIAKRLVQKAKDTGCAIALEDLQGIGQRTTARKAQRSRMKGWAFFQLRAFVTYKAERAGVPVVLIDPRNTSRTCSRCGHCEKANRKSRDEFACRGCHFKAPADWNAAQNIRTIGLKSCSLTASQEASAGVVDAGSGGPAETACKPRRNSGHGS